MTSFDELYPVDCNSESIAKRCASKAGGVASRAIGFVSLLLFLVSSLFFCNDYFIYQPSRQLYLHPRQLKLEHKEGYLYGVDGNRIASWYFKTNRPKPIATIAQFHGNAENMTSHYLSLIWLLEHGYNLFTFDYRGYGISEEEAESNGIFADAEVVIEWLQKKSADEKIPLILYGQSLGGVIAARALGNLSDRQNIAAIVLEGSFASFRDIGKSVLNRGLFPPLGYISYLLMSDRYGSRKAVPQIAPLPVFVVHGDQDRVIPFCFGEELYSLAKQPKEFLAIPKGGHIINWRRSDLTKERLLFLDIMKRYVMDYHSSQITEARP